MYAKLLRKLKPCHQVVSNYVRRSQSSSLYFFDHIYIIYLYIYIMYLYIYIHVDRCRYFFFRFFYWNITCNVYELHVKICSYLNTEIPPVSHWFKHVHFTAQSKIATLNSVVMLHCVQTFLHLLAFTFVNQQCWLKKSSLTITPWRSFTHCSAWAIVPYFQAWHRLQLQR